jgi:hypothetical protein
MKIKTEYVFPPIPDRSNDWSAIDDDTYDGLGSPIGRGPTEAEAIEDLKEKLCNCVRFYDGSPHHKNCPVSSARLREQRR